ncbi:MAG: class II aldolase/adducin family protein [Intrasporangium sp.]|uniref:class II aldolase/adducin family protein n=1 Tax=Intrasporangium sp. TaxID=1925024 RepID=UPI003F7CDE78
MPTSWNPGLVSDDLLELTRLLGQPGLDLAILAEGNTSELLDDGRLVVKASGANLASSTKEDFVVVDVDEVMALVDDPGASQADLTAVLVAQDASRDDGSPRRGSIETLVHAAVARLAREVGGIRFVGHTHPTQVVGLLASVHAADAWSRIVYSDEAVVIGHPLFVPYATPGIELGRLYDERLREYVAEHGRLPQLVLLGNHGIVATAPTAAGVEAVSLMAVKGARVRTIALSVGGLAPLSVADVAKFFARDDVAERRTNLARGR